MKIRYFFNVFFLLFHFIVFSQKKALIIAISNYPLKTGWSVINSSNDVPIIYNSLLTHGFEKESIAILTDEKATKKGIIMAFTELYNQSQPGDIVFIHYSGHGQQIEDDNDDELDGKDEALVPYNAFIKFSDSYKGENHIRDDELENIIHMFRNKLGPKGQLFILLDSCHSGSSTKGLFEDEIEFTDLNPSNFTNIFIKTALDSVASPFVMLSSAEATQSSTEISSPDQELSIGALTFAFNKSLLNLGPNPTYIQLYSQVAIEMKEVAKKQNPVIEGDVDYKIFSNERIKQQPYFTVLNTSNADTIRIQAGKAQFIFPGTTVSILPSGTSKVKRDKIITSGVVINSNYNQSDIKLNNALKDFDEKKYWIFIDQPCLEEASIKVSIQAENNELANQLAYFLNKNKMGTLINDSIDSDVHISKTQDKITFFIKSESLLKDSIYSSYSVTDTEKIFNKLVQIAHTQYLKKIKVKNSAYEFSFRLLPVEYDEITKTAIRIKEEEINEPMVYNNFSNNYWILEVSNKTDQPIYFNIIKFNNNGSFEPFLPNESFNLNPQETLIPSQKTMAFKNYVFSFDPLETKIFLKGFSSPSSITIQSIEKDGFNNQLGKEHSKEESKLNSNHVNKTEEKIIVTNTNADLFSSVEWLINVKK